MGGDWLVALLVGWQMHTLTQLTPTVLRGLQQAGFVPAVFVTPVLSPGIVKATLIVPYRAAEPGYAHYVEHLTWLGAFEGTALSSEDGSNAWTTEGSIIYQLQGPRGEFRRMLSTFAMALQPLSVPIARAEAERDIIAREYDYRVTGYDDREAGDALDRYLYQGNPGATSTIGTPEQIAVFSYEKAKSFHDLTHGPYKAALAVSGDISAEEVSRALVESRFPPLALRFAISPPAFRYAGRGKMTLSISPALATRPRMMWRKVAALTQPVQYDKLIQQCNLLQQVLSSALSGGLEHKLRYAAAVASTLRIAIFPLDESHVELRIWATPDIGVGFTALTSAMENSISQTSQLPAETFSRVLKRFLRSLKQSDDSPGWVANKILNRLINGHMPAAPSVGEGTSDGLNRDSMRQLIYAFARPGRVGVAYIGRDPVP